MKRKTKHIVYVSKETMSEPEELFDAVLAHFIKKEMPAHTRKKFLSDFMRAPTDEHQLAVIDGWVSVRDATTFPFRKEIDASKTDTGGVPVVDGADREPEPGTSSE